MTDKKEKKAADLVRAKVHIEELEFQRAEFMTFFASLSEDIVKTLNRNELDVAEERAEERLTAYERTFAKLDQIADEYADLKIVNEEKEFDTIEKKYRELSKLIITSRKALPAVSADPNVAQTIALLEHKIKTLEEKGQGNRANTIENSFMKAKFDMVFPKMQPRCSENAVAYWRVLNLS